jgi:hypothetical protein
MLIANCEHFMLLFLIVLKAYRLSLLIRKFIIFSFTTILFVFHDFFLPAYESKIFVVSFVKISRMLL